MCSIPFLKCLQFFTFFKWGAIGDVGVLQDDMKIGNDALVGGTVPQKISSCLSTLDLLLQNSSGLQSYLLWFSHQVYALQIPAQINPEHIQKLPPKLSYPA